MTWFLRRKTFHKELYQRSRKIISTHDLIDIWRIRNPTTKRLTWRQKNPLIQRRLDIWLISNSLQGEIGKQDIITSVKTDHFAITLDIDIISETNRGPSFWKFSNSFLDDESYIDLITDEIPIWLDEIRMLECNGTAL